MPDVSSGILGCGRSVITGLWHPYAYVNGGGQNLEWFRAAVLNQALSFSELDAAAADDTNDAELPFFVPHLGGRVSPAWPHLRGAWVGLHWNVSEASLFRAMLEGVALEYAIYRDAARRLQDDFIVREIRITGGGEKSAAWNQLKADRLQARVVTIERGGGAPMGAALLAGLGTGVIPDLRAALPQWIAFGRSFAPNVATANLSQQRARRYADLLAALHQWTAATP
jgi:xylulokinase